MKSVAKERRLARLRRHRRVRRKVTGTAERPRLCVYRSLKHIYAQVVNDTEQRSLFTVSSSSKEVQERLGDASNKTAVSTVVGQILAEKAKSAGIEEVAFDRGGFLYHGRIKALAEGAREGGLKF